MKKKKDDSTEPVTKGEFRLTMGEFRVTMTEFSQRMDRFEERMDNFEKRFATKKDLQDAMFSMKQYIGQRFDELKEELEEKMYTKAEHEKFMILVDEALTEVRAAREERILSQNKMIRMDDSLANHEKRICVLEKR